MTMAAQKTLDRPSLVFALEQYLAEANFRGYRPDRRKVLAVRSTDRGSWLREASVRSRWEVFYYIEGELFPEPGATRLGSGESVREGAERLAGRIWERLSLWNGYDFTATSYGLGNNTFLREDLVAKSRVHTGTHAPL
jgi:hypothetical protein